MNKTLLLENVISAGGKLAYARELVSNLRSLKEEFKKLYPGCPFVSSVDYSIVSEYTMNCNRLQQLYSVRHDIKSVTDDNKKQEIKKIRRIEIKRLISDLRELARTDMRLAQTAADYDDYLYSKETEDRLFRMVQLRVYINRLFGMRNNFVLGM